MARGVLAATGVPGPGTLAPAAGHPPRSSVGGVTAGKMSRAPGRAVVRRLYGLKRWMYRTGRPGMLARVLNRISALQYAAGVLSPSRAVTLEVPGRRTGRIVSFPVVATEYQGNRYLVSMLGQDANWVHNVRAADGRAVLRRGGREQVRLVEVPAAERAPIIKRYLAGAPGARPHVPVDRRAPLAEFGAIAGQFPVFQVTPAA